MKIEIEIADRLQSEICDLDVSLTYVEIVMFAAFTAREIRDQIPMYSGNLNAKWKLYNDVVAELESRERAEKINA